MSNNVNVRTTIELILINEIGSIVYHCEGSNYVKFVLIAVGIEFLGSCLDEKQFSETDSENRFNKAIKELFPRKYQRFSNASSKFYFYTQYRCSFVHQFRPGKMIVITHRKESFREKTKHLEELESGQVVLVLEDLYDDFGKACKKVIRRIDEGKISNKKVDDDFLSFIDVKK